MIVCLNINGASTNLYNDDPTNSPATYVFEMEDILLSCFKHTTGGLTGVHPMQHKGLVIVDGAWVRNGLCSGIAWVLNEDAGGVCGTAGP